MSASAVRMMLVIALGILLCVPGISLAQYGSSASQETVTNEATPMPAAMSEPAPTTPEVAPAAAPATSAEPAASASKETVAPQWIWGEVVSADKANNQLQIKHLDYETYEEVTKVIQADSGTLYENVSGIGDLKPGDSVTVDFKIKDGAQVAELIVVDKNRTTSEPGLTETPTSSPAVAPAMTEEKAAQTATPAAVETPAPAQEAAPAEGTAPAGEMPKPDQMPAPGNNGQ